MALWVIGYGVFLVSFFAACTAILGLKTAVWGFVVIFVGCTVTSLILWWRDELRWQASFPEQNDALFTPAPLSQAVITETSSSAQGSQQNQDWLPLEDDDFNLLETYTQDLTERVKAVYPLVGQDHVHQIVWAVMIELFCKRLTASPHNTPASIIAARMARAA